MPPEEHSKISPSSLERTILCPPSLLINEKYPNEDTIYTTEGTTAHALAEIALRSIFELPLEKEMKGVIEGATGEMVANAVKYANFVVGRVNRIIEKTGCSSSDIHIYPERRLDIDKYIPGCYGTADCAITSPERLVIVDYKYGYNKVPASGSPLLQQAFGYNANVQLSAYAAGLYDTLSDEQKKNIKAIEIYIFQPRAKGGAYAAGMGMSTSALTRFMSEAKDKVAIAVKGEGNIRAGEHCRFCKHKKNCTEYLIYCNGGYRSPAPGGFVDNPLKDDFDDLSILSF